METSLLRNREPLIKRPIGDLPCGRARGRQSARTFVFQRVGHDCFQNPAGGSHCQIVFALFQRAPAVGERLLDNLAKFSVVDKLEAARRYIL